MEAAAAAALARHGEAVATAREYARRAGTLRVVLLVDRAGAQPPLMVDCGADESVEITDGEQLATIPADADASAAPKPLPEIRAIPATAISMDLQTGELQAPLGAIEHLAETLQQLATAFGRRSVVSAEIATADPATPITLAAREGEPTVLAAGDYEYTLRQPR